ncbi:MAG: hypothetical protein MZV65_18955 [Chromatiales bacterium]|nr:hypothetical protein [Chromatiales bacterium]
MSCPNVAPPWSCCRHRAGPAANLPRPPRCPAGAGADDLDYLRRHLRWYIRRGLRKTGVPGLSIALVDDQQLLWAEGFGHADRARAPGRQRPRPSSRSARSPRC